MDVCVYYFQEIYQEYVGIHSTGTEGFGNSPLYYSYYTWRPTEAEYLKHYFCEQSTLGGKWFYEKSRNNKLIYIYLEIFTINIFCIDCYYVILI